MGSGRRKYKIRGRQREDRISSLPDEILGHILSFLPTNYAVATSALSSKWRNLYKLTSSLDFDGSFFFNPGKGLGKLRRKTSFGKFADTILARCKESHIGKFKLKCGKNFDHSLIRDWLKATSFCEIFELELSIHSIVPHSQLLQLSLSNCQNLVVLKLDSNSIVDVNLPKSVTLLCLRMLVLKEVKFIDGSCVSLILSGCPLLEELQIEGCAWNGGNLYIDNPLLKRLILDVGDNRPFDEFIINFVYLNAPSLIYLKYCESLAQQYDFRNLKALVEAHISIFFNDDEFDDPQDLCDAILDLIIGTSNCQLLYLSGQCLEALTSGEFQLPVFHNLTRLELGVGCDVSWEDVLLDFLNSSPCLKALTFVEGLVKRITEGESDFPSYDQAVASCLESCLKVIDIKNFRGVKEELDIATYFLKNANVLDKLVIHWRQPNKTKEMLDKEEEILKLPKASKTCSIVFRHFACLLSR